MSFIAAAVIGSAVVGGVTTYVAGEQAKDAAERGAAQAAGATRQSTADQLAEIRRQYDYQAQILLPQIQNQYQAQRAYTDMLGITPGAAPGAPPPGAAPGAPGAPPGAVPGQPGAPATMTPERQAAIAELETQIADAEARTTSGSGGAGTMRRRADARTQADYLRNQLTQLQAGPGGGGPGLPTMPASSGVGGMRSQEGYFVDPNLNPERLSDSPSAYQQAVEGNLLAGTTAEDDPFRNYLAGNRIAADSVEDSILARRADQVRLAEGAAGTGVYGDEFEASPGYAFQREEMERQLERQGSAGGPNIGGRAIMESQRRAQGLAAGDYYNWAMGRTRDLERLGQAEATDIGRGDQAYAAYEGQRIADIGRDDAGYQSYLARRAADASRLDTAGQQADQLRAGDRSREDQAYYNYLANVAGAAQFGGGPSATLVGVAGGTGQQAAQAYRGEGDALARTYGDLGASRANIDYAQAAGINNALQGGVQNYLAAGYAGANIPGFPT